MLADVPNLKILNASLPPDWIENQFNVHVVILPMTKLPTFEYMNWKIEYNLTLR